MIPLLPLNRRVADDDEVGTSFAFSYLGIVAGGLLVVALGASFLAIDKIGVAMAQGVFGGTAIMVSYLWGVVVFQEKVNNIPLSIFGLLMLIVGVVGIALNKSLTARLSAWRGKELNLLPNDSISDSYSEFDIVTPQNISQHQVQSEKDRLLTGILWAILVGLSGGSILAPSHYADPDVRGFAFIPSFGLGVIIISPLLSVAWFCLENCVPPLHLSTLPMGLLSGLLWNASNICAIIAIPILGYGVAYPILQCALFVAGIWGIIVFKEIKGEEIILFFSSGGILIAGAVCVAVSSA